MANTVIALKKSGTPSAIPVDLANGELAINYADGKIFYKSAAGSIQEISGGGGGNAFGTVNANGTLIVSDTTGDVFSLVPGDNITIVGDSINDKITIGLSSDVTLPGVLYIKPVGGDEGGQIELGNAVTNSTLAGNVIIDIYQNKLRFYEKESPNKGAFIDLSIAGSGVSSNLLAGGTGSSEDTVARETANAAYDKANSSNLTATSAYDYANSVGIIAIDAYDKANAANLLAYNTGIGANAFTSATIAGANAAVGAGANAYADLVGSSANSYLLSVIAGANAAVGTGANTVGSAAFDKANTAEIIAIAAYANSNTKLSTSGGTINGDLAVVGNLTVSGNTSYVSVQNYRVDDSLIYLAGNNYISDIVDIGFIANYVNSTGQNVHTGLYREHINKEYYLFYGYDQEPDNNHIDPNGNNFTIAVLNADLKTSNLVLGGQNTITWITAAYDKANAANLLAYNTGIGANAFTSATIAGANAAVGTGANAFTSATIAGANTAVGAGANSYAATVGTSANAFASATISGANTAVGVGANAFTSATIAGANTAVGAGANAFTSATVAGANAIASAAFTKANGAAQLAFVTVAANGTNLVADSNNDTLTLATTGNVSIIGNGTTDTATFDLTNTGVTASIYGGASAIPVITVDEKGRLTSVSNATSIAAATATTATTATNQSGGTVNATTGAFSGLLTANAGIVRFSANGPGYWLQQDGTGRSHWYWGTAGGASPTFSNSGEDASALTLHITNNGNGGTFFHRSANGFGKLAGDAITWTTTIYSDLNNFTWKGNVVLHAGNYNSYAPTLTGTGASGTWSINVTGSAGSASTATTATNLSGGTVSATTGSFSGRVIASAAQSSGTLLTATGSLGGIELVSSGNPTTNAAFMTFHRPSAYAAYFGIDTDNQFAIGGWSAGAALANMKVGSLGIGAAASGTAGRLTINEGLYFNQSNPTISASSYFVAPGGAYFSSGTVYTEARIQARGGIGSDTTATLSITGGTSGITQITGTVGIGRSNPGYALDVVGTVNASAVLVNGAAVGGFSSTNDTTTNATYYPLVATAAGGSSAKTSSTKLTFNPSTGTLSAVIFNSTSDINVKKDINTVTDALDKIDHMRGVNFKWKDTDQASIGVIAQEIEQIAPELVKDNDGIKSVNYDGLVGILIESIKELKARIEELEKNGR